MFEVWISSDGHPKWVFMGSFDTKEDADVEAEVLTGRDEDGDYWVADVRESEEY